MNISSLTNTTSKVLSNWVFIVPKQDISKYNNSEIYYYRLFLSVIIDYQLPS